MNGRASDNYVDSHLQFTLLATLVLGQPTGAVYLGVLEAGGEGTVRNNENVLSRPDVRLAFRFKEGAWTAMPHFADNPQALESLITAYPRSVSWILALHGRQVRSVEGHSPSKFEYYSEVGTQSLAASAIFPRISTGRKEFYVWGGTPAFRPLVAISRPNYADPDRWKPIHLTSEIALQAYPLFHTVVGIRLDCSKDTVRHDYSDNLIKPSGKAYRSAKGYVLLELKTSYTCNYVPNVEEWEAPVWFLLRDGAAKYVGRSLALVDAGDYDGDGASEVVFQYSGYNRGGYVLLHNHLTQVAEFIWNYH